MPSLLTVPVATGAAIVPLPGGTHAVTDMDIGVLGIGPDTHLFVDGPIYRVQHFGWYALGELSPGSVGWVGHPGYEIAWWKYFDFCAENPSITPFLIFPVDALIYSIRPGCSAYINVSG